MRTTRGKRRAGATEAGRGASSSRSPSFSCRDWRTTAGNLRTGAVETGTGVESWQLPLSWKIDRVARMLVQCNLRGVARHVVRQITVPLPNPRNCERKPLEHVIIDKNVPSDHQSLTADPPLGSSGRNAQPTDVGPREDGCRRCPHTPRDSTVSQTWRWAYDSSGLVCRLVFLKWRVSEFLRLPGEVDGKQTVSWWGHSHVPEV